MPREKKQKDITIENLKEQHNPYENFIDQFSSNLYKSLDKLSRNPYYQPLYANSLIKDINTSPNKPSISNLKKWLENPSKFEKNLRDLSQYLENVVNQYKRSISHFSSILSMNYYMYPLNKVPKDSKSLNTYKNSKNKGLDWLQKFRPKEQFVNVMDGVMLEGGKYYYVRESEKYIDLQEMPQDFSCIDGRSSIGYTYAFDISFFSNMSESLNYFAPEFDEWYKDFIIKQRGNKSISGYIRMPVEKSVVFKFDDSHASIVPPLSGVFKDALQIQEYKDLLKTKTQLDTWQVIMQEIPKDKDGKPTIDPILAGQLVAMVQGVLPHGVVTAATPFKAEAINFSQSQTQNNIIGLGEQNFWSTVGTSEVQFGGQTSSAAVLKYSNKADYLYVKHMYKQFERFINYQLSLVTGEYKFAVKFFGNAYESDEESSALLTAAQAGMPKKKLIASFEYEPFEYENLMDDEELEGLIERMKPLMSSHTMSGDDGGRPTKKTSELSQSGIDTIDGGYNVGKV